jgi:hypothetical protein
MFRLGIVLGLAEVIMYGRQDQFISFYSSGAGPNGDTYADLSPCHSALNIKIHRAILTGARLAGWLAAEIGAFIPGAAISPAAWKRCTDVVPTSILFSPSEEDQSGPVQ